MQRFVEDNYLKKEYGLDKNGFSLVLMVERGPRKGLGDFIPTRVRIRSTAEKKRGDAGTVFGLNSLDSRANAQADWDGDKVRYTYDFGGSDQIAGSKWEGLKQAYKHASLNEEYLVPETTIRNEFNIFGLRKNSRDELSLSLIHI